MDLLDGYASSGSDENDSYQQPPPPIPVVRQSDKMSLNAAPQPSLMAIQSLVKIDQQQHNTNRNKRDFPSRGGASKNSNKMVLMNNPLKSNLLQPTQGPVSLDPNGPKPTSRGIIGQTESTYAFDDVTFDEERKRFQRTGMALGPNATGAEVNCDPRLHKRYNIQTGNTTNNNQRKRKLALGEEEEGYNRLIEGDDDEATYGIWGPPSKAELAATQDQLTDLAAGVELAPEQIAEREHLAEKARRKGQSEEKEAEQFDRMVERKMSHLLPPRLREEPEAIEASTKFHGSESDEFDYKGKSWMEAPSGVKPASLDMEDHSNYVPKKCVHRFTGHNKGVHRIRLFPRTGHLLLSGGLEGKCKVWSIAEKKCMRTYIGHSAAVRDVQFNNDGTKFLSCSFDRYLRLWDVESGDVLGTYTNRRVPYVIKFYPKDDNTFVVGCSDNKIVAYDATTGEITQEYNHHLAPVNTITFCEDDTKMLTSSDDKKVLVWEWDIGVPIKYISDPTMHSMPSVCKHPSDLYWAGQSLDNQICVFQARDRFALQGKKKFTGHQVAGYACDLCFSPDGRFLASGDGDGRLFFWDWRSHKVLQKYRAHDDGPTIGCVWHPSKPSVVFTCGWDGVIKMWR